MRHRVLVDVTRAVDAVDRAVAGHRGERAARVAGQRQLDGDVGKRAPHLVRVGVAHHAAQQRGRLLLGVGVGTIQPGQRPVDLGRPHRQPRFELVAGEFGLGLDVQAGEDELHLVAEAAEGVQRHLQLRRRWLPGDAADQDPVGAVLVQLDAVEPGRHVRSGVARALDLVHELRFDGVDGDRAAGIGVLGDDARAVAADLGDREAGPAQVGDLAEEGVVAAGRLGAALDHVPGDDAPASWS
ncbi:hypothetical protein C1Y40_00847 [Mycobacterium talmoniae]|uniref:Uncharacterized protein n=1 Tax=Mycobacterium talmoniae TaxID=1858794 RepID=A0A2S8BQL8_9MYCO|nr:hypothetical protein C1Y40_00847 [Mycobacterium talmoniae]